MVLVMDHTLNKSYNCMLLAVEHVLKEPFIQMLLAMEHTLSSLNIIIYYPTVGCLSYGADSEKSHNRIVLAVEYTYCY